MASRDMNSKPQTTPISPSPLNPPAAGGLLQRACACGQHTYGGSECSSCKSGSSETLQRASSSEAAESNSVPSIVHEVLSSPGQPLDKQTRAFMESRFAHNFSGVPARTSSISRSSLTVGPANDPLEQEADRMAGDVLRTPAPSQPGSRADFSGVRIHTNAQAAASSHAVNARAYTVGQHIVFGEGRYAPGSSVGQKLLAHELAHTVQQSKSAPAAARLQRTIGDGHDLTSPRFSLMVDLEAVFDDERTLTVGDTGRGVQAVQQALYDLGFPLRRFGADGTFRRDTTRALRRFQRANPPLAVTGDIDRATMEALNTRFAAVTLSAALLAAPWTQSCVNSILCPWSPNTIRTLGRRGLRVRSFDSIFWDDLEWDGASWVVSPFPGDGYNTGSEIGVVNESCEGMAETLYHEVLHANQPRRHRTTLQRESYAYRIGEEFNIAMGFAGDPSLRSTDAQGREFADPALVDASLQPGGSASYPGVSAAGGGEEILARVGADRVRVRRANGTVYVRPAAVGEKVPGPIRTVNPATHPRSGWVCP